MSIEPTVKRWSQLSTLEVYAIAKLRSEVFYREQHVEDDELDWRDVEDGTTHVFIAEGRRVVAYLRILHEGDDATGGPWRSVGRMVVSPDRRGSGLAQQLLARVVDRFGDATLTLHAQTYVADLYAKVGFEPHGEVFDEAGIPHIAMTREPSPH